VTFDQQIIRTRPRTSHRRSLVIVLDGEHQQQEIRIPALVNPDASIPLIPGTPMSEKKTSDRARGIFSSASSIVIATLM